MKNKKNIDKKRFKILKASKKHIPFEGWTEELFKKVSYEMNISPDEIKVLFLNGSKDLLDLYLKETRKEIQIFSKKLKLIHLRTSERISKIIMTGLEKKIGEKEIIRKTLYTLMIPSNLLIGSKFLYKIVNDIWYLSGDNSSDFNFYTKRLILSGILFRTLLYWTNNEDYNLEKTKIFLEKSLRRTKFFPKIRSKLSKYIKNSPKIFNLFYKYNKFRQ